MSTHPITEEAFARAQAAELSNWARHTDQPGHIRHELEEHAEIAGPLRRLVGARRFEHGLEVGIGPYGLGFLAVHFAEQVAALDGIDPLPRLVLNLDDPVLQRYVDEVRARTNYTRAPGEAIPAEPETYDIVSCINVVDHGRDPSAILHEIERVLRPGGILVFGVSTLSMAGLLQWRLKRWWTPDQWLFVAHPHIFAWHEANRLAERVAGRTLWHNRPGWTTRLWGHGRMSFWIREKRAAV